MGTKVLESQRNAREYEHEVLIRTRASLFFFYPFFSSAFLYLIRLMLRYFLCGHQPARFSGKEDLGVITTLANTIPRSCLWSIQY